MPISCGPTTSVGWRRCTCGQAAASETSGASKRPIASEMGSRTGRDARTPIRMAPPRATQVMMSMPSTQCTVAVDRATVSVSRRTSTADQKRPPPTDSRMRSHSLACGLSLKAASGLTSRPSGDTYRISRPHQAGEVVALTDHVEVDVLPKVEAWILVGAAEARGVDVEDDQRRSPAAHRLQKLNPRRVRARGDDR